MQVISLLALIEMKHKTNKKRVSARVRTSGQLVVLKDLEEADVALGVNERLTDGLVHLGHQLDRHTRLQTSGPIQVHIYHRVYLIHVCKCSSKIM